MIRYALAILLLLVGCSSQQSFEPQDPRASVDLTHESLLNTQSLIRRFGVVRQPEIARYLNLVAGRIDPYHNYKITVLDQIAPMAVSPGGGHISISSGLLKQLRTEAELAFVIAHEIAHQQMHHPEQLKTVEGQLVMKDTVKEFELEADRKAVILITRSGYNPEAAIQAIPRAYRHADLKSDISDYPTPAERLSLVKRTIELNKLESTGVSYTRGFRRLQSQLLARSISRTN